MLFSSEMLSCLTFGRLEETIDLSATEGYHMMSRSLPRRDADLHTHGIGLACVHVC